jgi:hypothetical protein
VTKRVAYARQLVAEGHSPSALARILQISRQAIYRIPTTRPAAAGRSRPPLDNVDAAIVTVAEQAPRTATGSSLPGCLASWGGR